MTKRSKMKLPKRIAGVKVPKRLRKDGAWLVELIDTPQGKAFVASLLGALLSTLGGAKPRGKLTAKKARRRAKFAVEEGADRAGEIAQAVAGSVTAVLDRWFGHDQRRDKDASKDRATAH